MPDILSSTAKGSRRVLAWQEDVARSISPSEITDIPYHPPSVPRSLYYRTNTYPSLPMEVTNYPSLPLEVSYPSHPMEVASYEPQPPPMRLVRRDIVRTTEHYGADDPSEPGMPPSARVPEAEREVIFVDRQAPKDSGISGKTLIGTLLGAAAGAAVAYAMVRSESPERMPAGPAYRRVSADNIPTRRELAYTAPIQPPLMRSFTAPYESPYDAPYVAPYDAPYDPRPAPSEVPHPFAPQYTAIEPAPSTLSTSTRARGADAEYEYLAPSVAQLRLDDKSYVSARSERRSEHTARSEATRTVMAPPPPESSASRRDRSPGASHVSRRTSASRRERERDVDTESSADYRSSASRSHHSHHHSGRSHAGSKAASHVSSSKTHRTESTAKQVPLPATVQTVMSSNDSMASLPRSKVASKAPSKVGSKTSTTTITVIPAQNQEPPRSETGRSERRSEMSARQVPLPHSVISGLGYAESVAPSDSVSSVGNKRERERRRERLFYE